MIEYNATSHSRDLNALAVFCCFKSGLNSDVFYTLSVKSGVDTKQKAAEMKN